MDHESAIRTRATEKYLLGELSEEEREQFEEHFFACPACADDIRTGMEFAAGARAVFRDDRNAKPVTPQMPVHSTPWWRGAWTLPASTGLNVALLAVTVALGLLVMRPLPQNGARDAYFVQEVPVLGPQRGGDSVRQIARQTSHIVVTAFLPDNADSMRYQIFDADGRVVNSGKMGSPPRESSGQSLLSIPVSNLMAGEYRIVLLGQDHSGPPLGARTFRIAQK